MNGKKFFLVCCLIYLGSASFFFFHNVGSLGAESTYDAIVKNEKINDPDKRAEIRAFYSAPPVIPHEVTVKSSKECLTCHLNVRTLEDGRVTVKTPHPQFSNCTQCHVAGSLEGYITEIDSLWEGLEEPKRGDRWSPMSPPTIPHRVRLRENCLSCHGPDNPDMRIRTPHPKRTSCLQCHVPNYANEF